MKIETAKMPSPEEPKKSREELMREMGVENFSEDERALFLIFENLGNALALTSGKKEKDANWEKVHDSLEAVLVGLQNFTGNLPEYNKEGKNKAERLWQLAQQLTEKPE